VTQQRAAIQVLRWTLGLVVLWESYRFAFSAGSAQHLHAMGLPSWIAPLLGGLEIAAAVLFLMAKTARLGGVSLLVIFAVAVVLHFMHRQYDVGALLVYGAAVIVCLRSGRLSAAH
jgi:uncharacterized membrane protein YphA (DoxX/SURF4 family)